LRQSVCSFALTLVLGAVCTQTSVAQGGSPAAGSSSTRQQAANADIDLSAIKPTVNACQDFYEHACGGFIDASRLSPDHSEVSVADQKFQSNLEAGLNRLFTMQAPANSELGRLSTFYGSCRSDPAFSTPLIERWLGRIDSARTASNIQNLFMALSEIGIHPFFSYSGQPDPNDLGKYRGEIGTGKRDLWQEPAVVERTFKLAGITAEQAKSDARAVGTITDDLLKHRSIGSDPRTYENPTTLAQLMREAPAIDWPRYFKLVGASPRRSVNVTSKQYLPAVSHELATRSLPELRAYLRWSFLFSLRGELPAPYNEAFSEIPPSLRVAVHEPVKRCRDATLRAMGVELSRQYAHLILGVPARTAAIAISASLRDEIVQSVEQTPWLSPAARKATAEKLRQTDLKIGFPDHWPEVGHFPLSRNNFVANVLTARRYEEHRAWHRANETRSRKNWDMLVFPWVGTGMAAARLTTPNGFPDPDTNSMIMTAAFFTPPLFDRDASLEINYGSYGEVFAHEFVHIAETHNYGAIGQPQELWSAADIDAANRQHQCVIDQANASPAPGGSHVSGERNYSENVADLGAIRLAYEALAKKLGPGLNTSDATGMTPAKRFFYKFAQNSCTAATPETLKQLIVDDPHGLPSYRVNGPLSNLPAFGETFECRAGTPMRRTSNDICRVW